MNILVIGSRVPFPLRDGGAIATFTMLKEFADAGNSVTYFTFNTKKHFVHQKDIQQHLSFCRVVAIDLNANVSLFGAMKAFLTGINYNLSRFFSKNAESQLLQLLQTESFDIIQFEGLFSLPLLSVVKRLLPEKSIIYRAHNVEYKIWKSLAIIEKKPLKKVYLKHLYESLKREESALLKQVDVILSITPEDALEFKTINSQAMVLNFPAGILLPEKVQSPPKVNPATICHLGSMEWLPNREAVKWFASEVLPLLKSKIPEVEFHIAGKSLSINDPQFQFPGVVNHGEVDSAIDFVSSYSIVVVPLKAGSGLRMKLLEAMFLGKAVVSTTCGAAGLEYQNRKHLIVVDSLEDWVFELCSLLQNSKMAEDLGWHAANLVREKYDNRRNCATIIELYKKLSDN